MRVQEHVVERLVKVPAEAVGWASLRGEMACPDCLITTYQPEMGLERARRIIHHILWQYPPSWLTRCVFRGQGRALVNSGSLHTRVYVVMEVTACTSSSSVSTRFHCNEARGATSSSPLESTANNSSPTCSKRSTM